MSKNYNISSYPTLENCFFGDVSLTKHVDIDQYKHSGYGIKFDRKRKFSFGNMSSSIHANNKTKNILVLRKDFVQRLDNTTICRKNVFNPIY